MTEEELKLVASQLRKPDGEIGIQVAERMNSGNKVLNELVIEEMTLKPGFKVVEIGMANGFFVPKIFQKENKVEYTGFDFSETMVRHATELNKNLVEKGSVHFVQSHAANLPFNDNEVDILFTLNTIYFYDDPKVELQEYFRILKPGGHLFIGIRPKSLMQYYPMTKFGFKMYEPDDVIELLKTCGFNNSYFKIKEEEPQMLDEVKLEVSSVLITAVK